MAVNPQDVAGLGGQQTGVQVGGQTTTLPDVAQGVTGPTAAPAQNVAPAFADALASLSLIESEHEGIEILAALPNQGFAGDGTLLDTVDVSYRIIGRPGVYTVSVPAAINWQAIAFFEVGLQANAIELIYEEAASLDETPQVFLVPPPSSDATIPRPQPGQAVPV